MSVSPTLPTLGTPNWAWVFAGIVLVIVLFQYAPKVGGGVLLLLVLGYLAFLTSKGVISI